MQTDYDIIIVGGGLAGNCLALALKDSQLRIALVEAQTREQQQQSPAGDRALALSAGTIKLLEALNVWQELKPLATAIKQIHISDHGHFGKTRLSAEKEKVAALGYVITARDIESQIAERVEQTRIEKICPAQILGLITASDFVHVSIKQNDKNLNLSTRLLIGADGGQSSVRRLLEISQSEVDYQQTAIVTTVTTEYPHNNVAYERFTPAGPLAMLPVDKNHSSVVWTRKNDDVEALISATDTEFVTALQTCFGYRLGKISLSSARHVFPLKLIRADALYSRRCVIVGNAVHQLHPVAGQGFNLAMRDVAQLAETILLQDKSGKDIGEQTMLQNYAESRQTDHTQTINFTSGLIRIFSNDWLPLSAARSISLGILDHIPAAKSVLARHAMGLSGRLPRIGNRH